MSKECRHCNTDKDLLQGDIIIEHEYGDYSADMFIIGGFDTEYYFQLNIENIYSVDCNSVQINFCPMCGRDLRKEVKDV